MREYCFKITDSEDENKDELITCKVGGIDIKLLIDSGSKVNILKKQDWELLSNNKAAAWEVDEKPNQTLKSYASGQALDIKHKFQTTISVKNGKELVAHFYVVPRGEISILGKETAKRLGILKPRLYINAIEEEVPFPKIKKIVIKLTIDSTVKPVRQPRNGNEVTITRKDGQILRRHISHVKKIPTINIPTRESFCKGKSNTPIMLLKAYQRSQHHDQSQAALAKEVRQEV
nr:unnamed protein product [Callosobruchus analis]